MDGKRGMSSDQGCRGMQAGYSTTRMQFSPPYWFQQRVVQQGSSVQMPSTTNRYSYSPGARKKVTFQLPSSSRFRGRVEGSQLLNVPATATSRAWGAWTVKLTRFFPTVVCRRATSAATGACHVKHLLHRIYDNCAGQKLQQFLNQTLQPDGLCRNLRVAGKEQIRLNNKAMLAFCCQAGTTSAERRCP